MINLMVGTLRWSFNTSLRAVIVTKSHFVQHSWLNTCKRDYVLNNPCCLWWLGQLQRMVIITASSHCTAPCSDSFCSVVDLCFCLVGALTLIWHRNSCMISKLKCEPWIIRLETDSSGSSSGLFILSQTGPNVIWVLCDSSLTPSYLNSTAALIWETGNIWKKCCIQ